LEIYDLREKKGIIDFIENEVRSGDQRATFWIDDEPYEDIDDMEEEDYVVLLKKADSSSDIYVDFYFYGDCGMVSSDRYTCLDPYAVFLIESPIEDSMEVTHGIEAIENLLESRKRELSENLKKINKMKGGSIMLEKKLYIITAGMGGSYNESDKFRQLYYGSQDEGVALAYDYALDDFTSSAVYDDCFDCEYCLLYEDYECTDSDEREICISNSIDSWCSWASAEATKEDLDSLLEDGEITQEDYDKHIRYI
jgi:hypothetical protein